MLIVTLQRNKCIGCNYCVELAPELFQMSKKDGKSVLLRAVDNKGFHTLKTTDMSLLDTSEAAALACPVKIISVKVSGK